VSVDPRLVAATELQVLALRRTLADGHARLGWKLGMGDAERIAGSLAVGHLTTATRLEPEDVFAADRVVDLRVDVELAVVLGRDISPWDDAGAAACAVRSFATALELVDLGNPQDAEAVVAANIFHRAVAFGEPSAMVADDAVGRLVRNGRDAGSGSAPGDLGERLATAARVLDAVGERLAAGDVVITGSIVPPLPVSAGSRVEVDLGPLGALSVRFPG